MGSIACGISSRFHGRSRDIRDRTDVQVGVLVLAEGRPADRARSLHRRCAILTTTHLTDFWPCATFNRPPRCSGSIWSSWYGGWDEVERVPVPFLSRRSPAREDGPAQERLQSSMALQHDPWASGTTSACQPLRARWGSRDAALCCVLPVSRRTQGNLPWLVCCCKRREQVDPQFSRLKRRGRTAEALASNGATGLWPRASADLNRLPRHEHLLSPRNSAMVGLTCSTRRYQEGRAANGLICRYWCLSDAI
jgi:hypothetical protein